MNIKLEKELKEGYPSAWYRVTVDDRYINGSYDIESMQQLYERIKANPDILKNQNEILRSDEI